MKTEQPIEDVRYIEQSIVPVWYKDWLQFMTNAKNGVPSKLPNCAIQGYGSNVSRGLAAEFGQFPDMNGVIRPYLVVYNFGVGVYIPMPKNGIECTLDADPEKMDGCITIKNGSSFIRIPVTRDPESYLKPSGKRRN